MKALLRLCLPLLAVVAASLEPAAAARQPVILSTTTMLQSAVREVAGSRRAGRVLIPGGSCPGHYDVRSGDMAALDGGAVLFCHGYEGFLTRLQRSAAGRSVRIIRAGPRSSWLVPSGYRRGLQGVCDALCRLDPSRSREYRAATARAIASCDRNGTVLRDTIRRAGASGQPVLCSGQLAEFVRWLGLDVVGTFDRPEDLTPKRYRALCVLARERRVRVVIDNVQSAGAGRSIAAAVHAKAVSLSNFPGGLPATPDWQATVRRNVQLLAAAFNGSGRWP